MLVLMGNLILLIKRYNDIEKFIAW